jgi:[ribosomal protein S5]-alanine N-acetyltransferase
MILTLAPISINEDKSNKIYSSDDCQLILKTYEDYYPKVGYLFPWVGYFVKLENQIVGACGFVGPPINNRVEIAYGTFKEFEGQGIASFSCKQLISIAKKANPHLIITAKTAPENNASTRILKRNGFVYTGIVQDHEIGDAWEWILKEVE